MKPPAFTYHGPATVEEALDCLSRLDDARIIAGGQSLMPMLNLRLVAPQHLLDVGRVAGMRHVDETAGGILIGAATTQRALERSPVVQRSLPIVATALDSVGHIQTRNRGTVGGSLCHLDPAAELPLLAMLYDAEVLVRGRCGERAVAFADFAEDMMAPAIAEDELVTDVLFRPWAPGHGWGFHEFSRRKGDFAIVAAACLLEAGADGRILRAAVALGGATATPIRIAAAEAALTGVHPGPEIVEPAAAPCGAIEALDDPFVPAWYRRRIAPKVAARAIADACARLMAEEPS